METNGGVVRLPGVFVYRRGRGKACFPECAESSSRRRRPELQAQVGPGGAGQGGKGSSQTHTLSTACRCLRGSDPTRPQRAREPTHAVARSLPLNAKEGGEGGRAGVCRCQWRILAGGTLKSSGSQVWLLPACIWGCAYVQQLLSLLI